MLHVHSPRAPGFPASTWLALTALIIASPLYAEIHRPPGTPADPTSRPFVDVEVEHGKPQTHSEFALGMAMKSSPEYLGSSRQGLSLRPIFAYRYGRFKLSSSGGSAILNFGERAEDSGASADLIETTRWKIKTSARIGGGRSPSDSADLAGLPTIKRTVFARLSATYKLTEHVSIDSTLGWDLLGNGNGAFLSTGVGYSFRSSPRTEWSMGLGLTYGNATHMDGLFGVPAGAASADRPAYVPGAGLRDAGVGIGFMTSLTHRWIAFGSLGLNTVLGPAADSPLTTATVGHTATIGIGWRCCR